MLSILSSPEVAEAHAGLRARAEMDASPVVPDAPDRYLVDDAGSTSVTVVIPALNEARNIPFVLNTIPSWVDQILVVDGASTDKTEQVVAFLRPDAQVIKELKRGKGAAIVAGLRASKSDVTVIMDADGSMDGADIDSFLRALSDGADYVKGTRFGKGGGSVDITPIRRLGDWALCQIISALFGARFTDATYGFKAIRSDCVDLLDIDTEGFEVEILIDLRAHQAGLRTVEVPCFETARIYGASNLNAFRDGLRCGAVIAKERWRRHVTGRGREFG
jgi:glycosyltransferase involved in cell wall biosynthesis